MTNKKNIKRKLFFFALLTLLFTLTSNKAKAECVYDGTNFRVKDKPENIVTPIHRLYNTRNGVHLYTKGISDASAVLRKWSDFEFTDGTPAFCTSLNAQEGLTPIYRLYNTRTGVHLYTRGDNERDAILNKWGDFEFTDGVPAFYTSLTAQDGLTPIYRLYNTRTGVHLYTRGDNERDAILNKWGDFEFTDGVPAFYAHITYDKGPDILNPGPDIFVGLWYYEKSAIQDSPFRIDANKPYNIKDKNGNVIAQVGADTTTEVTYDSDGNLEVSGSISSALINSSVTFDATDGDNSTMIFDVHRPDSSFDEYRNKITVRYYRGPDIIHGSSETVTQIWVINTLPLEHYVWGMGETTGTGDIEHTKVMTTIFRTYGKWYIEYATKYLPLGFKIRSDSSSQIYYGYNWETGHPNITTAAKATRGAIATYGSEIALTPYSSWTDGRTRSFEERWGSTAYPWCKSVSDPYGKHPSYSTSQLENSGNHMVGMSANGSVVLARDHDWDYQRILKYYYTGISLSPLY